MTVDSVQYNQKKIVFQHSANKITITLPTIASKNTVGPVEVFYRGAPPQSGFGSFGWVGGMEHQTMSFMTSLEFELVAHEMAHQWFGDYITLASWHDIWLNEGFATYLTGLTYENLLNSLVLIGKCNIILADFQEVQLVAEVVLVAA